MTQTHDLPSFSAFFPDFWQLSAAFPRPLELRLGAYFATGHLVAVGSATQLRTESETTASTSATARRVLLGTVERLRRRQEADWPVETWKWGKSHGGIMFFHVIFQRRGVYIYILNLISNVIFQRMPCEHHPVSILIGGSK